jgi:K+-transporting ATPase c subunit
MAVDDERRVRAYMHSTSTPKRLPANRQVAQAATSPGGFWDPVISAVEATSQVGRVPRIQDVDNEAGKTVRIEGPGR